MRLAVVSALVVAVAALGAFFVLRGDPAPAVAGTVADAGPATPAAAIDAAQIASGRISMDRMPREVSSALETYSEEIVRTAEAVQTKQARVTGTCAPGSAIRLIAEDGTVRCQALPKGAVSVPAIAGVPRLSTTVTEAGNVPGGTGRYQAAGPDDYLIVPIALPDGALVTSFSYTVFDASQEADSEAFLYRSDDQPLASVASRGADARVRVETTEQVQLRKIDAARYAYFVYFQVSARAGARLMPISAQVAYRLP